MATLHEPAHRVSPRAKQMWRVDALARGLVLLVPLAVAWWLIPDHPWWATAAWLLVAVYVLVTILVMPQVRYRVHRWEVTDEAVFTRSGWLGRSDHIAPLSRVQTVDSHQTAIMRLFGLANISVSTASAFGAIKIQGLDAPLAESVVADLTTITARTPGDAT